MSGVSRVPAPRVVVATVLTTALALAAAGCTDGSREADLSRPAATSDATESRDAQAAEVLAALGRTLAGPPGDAADPAELAAPVPGAARALRDAAANVEALDLRAVSVRYLAESGTPLSGRERRTYGDDAWVADAQVSWQVRGVDRTPAVLTLPVVLAPDADGDEQAVAGFDVADSDRTPLWLLTRLSVVRTPRTVVAAPDRGGAEALSALAVVASTSVRRVVPAWTGTLFVQEAADQRTFQLAAGLPAQQARAVAGVTTTADGAGDPDSPGQVFTNPRLFDPLSREGKQIVVSHEAAHVALGSATASTPLWLSEGIADYVALRGSELSTDRLANQILTMVREDGAPRSLPGPSAFDGSDRRIGAWYEASWLAARLLAETYGDDALFRFYRVVARTGRAEPAFRTVLGTTQPAFVRAWRAYLVDLA